MSLIWAFHCCAVWAGHRPPCLLERSALVLSNMSRYRVAVHEASRRFTLGGPSGLMNVFQLCDELDIL